MTIPYWISISGEVNSQVKFWKAAGKVGIMTEVNGRPNMAQLDYGMARKLAHGLNLMAQTLKEDEARRLAKEAQLANRVWQDDWM